MSSYVQFTASTRNGKVAEAAFWLQAIPGASAGQDPSTTRATPKIKRGDFHTKASRWQTTFYSFQLPIATRPRTKMITSASLRTRRFPQRLSTNLFLLVRCLPRQLCLASPRVAAGQLHTTPIVAIKKRPRDRNPHAPNNRPPSPPSPPAQKPPLSNPPGQNTPAPEKVSQSGPAASESTPSSSNTSPSNDPEQPPKSEAYDTLLNDEKYQAFRGRQAQGLFTWKTVALFLLTGTGLVLYFRYEKERVNRLRSDLVNLTD